MSWGRGDEGMPVSHAARTHTMTSRPARSWTMTTTLWTVLAARDCGHGHAWPGARARSVAHRCEDARPQCESHSSAAVVCASFLLQASGLLGTP
eukprot:7172783-Alexandrium_andersonii.AAC.1